VTDHDFGQDHSSSALPSSGSGVYTRASERQMRGGRKAETLLYHNNSQLQLQRCICPEFRE
jgi:hypothetical protein